MRDLVQILPKTSDDAVAVLGMVVKEWSHWSDHTDHEHQYIDILMHDGRIERYWRPLRDTMYPPGWDPSKDPFECYSFWEICGHHGVRYRINKVEKDENNEVD